MFSRKFIRDTLLRPFRGRGSQPIRKTSRTIGKAIETLEDRTVPAITLSFVGGVATFTGDGSNDRLEVHATATSNEILYNSGGIGLATLSGVNQLIFNAGGGNDLFILSSAPGTHFAPSGGITYNAGGQAGDELAMIGGASTWTSTYNPTGPQAGSLSFTNTPGTLTQNITFTGVPTIRNSMQGANLAVTTPTTAADTINVFTGPNLGNIGAVQQGPVLIDGGDRDDHGSFGPAQNIWTGDPGHQHLHSMDWSLASNANIVNSTTVPHISIVSTAATNPTIGATADFYGFYVAVAGSVGYIDIDSTSGVDTMIAIYDHHGTVLAVNNNNTILDPGSSSLNDSFLTFTFPEADHYIVAVTRFTNLNNFVDNGVLTSNGGINGGASYTLHISVENNPVGMGTGVVNEVEPNETATTNPAGNRNGWKFIEQGMNFVMSGAFNSAPANTVLAVGVTGGNALAALNSVASVLGYMVTHVSGASISTVNFNNYRVLYVPSDSTNTTGGITQANLNLLNARSLDIRDFINAGGGIFSAGTEVSSTNPYGWLQIPDPFTITSLGGSGGISQPLRKTPAAIAAGLTISDVELSAGVPYHNSFSGPPGFNNLLPFVLDTGPNNIAGDSDDRVIALGLGAIQNPGLGGAGPSTAITFGNPFGVIPPTTQQYPTMYLQSTTGLTLNGQGMDDAYNIQLGVPILTNIAIADSGGTSNDVATIYGSNGSDYFNLNTAIANTLVWGSPTQQTVSWTPALDVLNLHSPAFPGEPSVPPALPSATDGPDTFIVTPAVNTAINLLASNPVAPTTGYGDILYLNAMGLTGPITVTNLSGGLPAMPDGRITSGNRGTVTWTSIETVPVPLGLGGTFDFQPTATGPRSQLATFSTDAHLQGNFHREVLPSDTLTNTSSPFYFPGLSAYAAGWVNPGQGAFNRPTVFGPAGDPGGPINKLLYDGQWGLAGSPANALTNGNVTDPNNGIFQVTVAPNVNVMVTAYIGDMFYQRDRTNVYVGNSVVGFTKLNPSIDTFTTASTADNFVGYSGMFNPGNSNVLQIVVETVWGGTSAYWTISGLDVRPEGLINSMALTRVLGTGQAGPLQSNPLVADGLSVDYYHGTGALPGAVLTILPQYGTPVDSDENAGNGLTPDAYPKLAGFQVIADATGQFGFGVRRPTGIGPSVVTVLDATGVSGTGWVGPNAGGTASASPNPYPLPSVLTQPFQLPTSRRIDFGTSTSPVATDSAPTDVFNPTYIGVGNQTYQGLSPNALGWVGTQPQTFDQGATYTNLQRDGVYNAKTSPGDFMIDMPLANTSYVVTVLLGNPSQVHDLLYVAIIDPTAGTVSSTPVQNVTVPAGQSTSVTFTAMSDANGKIRLRFGTAASVSTAFWVVQSLEIRPTQGTITITSTTPGARLADGTTLTTYNITGATPDAIITLTTTLGTITTADGSALYTGKQVVASPTGTASFIIQSPTSPIDLVGTITASETTGLRAGTTLQNYTGVVPPPPPAVPPAAVYQGFDFGTNTSPLHTVSGNPMTRITGSNTFSATNGYGWASAVGDYNRLVNGLSTPSGVPSDLFIDGVWGNGAAGVFQYAVPLGMVSRDVRLYVGEPYYTWPDVELLVEGNPVAATVDTTVGWYGYVTATGTDANNDGLLNISIRSKSNSVWVAAGLEIAAVGALPAPLTAPATTLPVAGLRLDMNGSPVVTASGFTGVPGTQSYTPATGYGWVSGVSGSFNRGTTIPTGLTSAHWDIYRDATWGMGTGIFAFAVPSGAPNTYLARVYIGDSYTNWGGISLSIEGNATPVAVNTSANPFWTYTLTGSDVNGDGIVTLKVNGPIWVVNAIDLIRSPGPLPGSAGPSGSPQLAEGGAVRGGKAATITVDHLAPLAAEAVRRWEAAGVSPAQLDALRSVSFVVTDLGATGLLGLTSVGGNLIRIDDDGAGRGWFIDSTPGDDVEFGSTVNPVERSGTVGGYDLLTVIMHEMGHTIGLDSLDPRLSPSQLMTATLGTGIRRVPAANAWATDGLLQLLVDETKPVSNWATDVPPLTRTDDAAQAAQDVVAPAPIASAKDASSARSAAAAWPDDDDMINVIKVG